MSRAALEPVALEDSGPARRSAGVFRWRTAAGALSWATLILVSALWGRSIGASGPRLYVDTPPLAARIDPAVSTWAVPAVILALATVVLGPRVARRLQWPLLLLLATGVAAAWAVALALARGPDELIRPLLAHTDYLAAVETVSSPEAFLAGFTERIGTYPAHVRAHPPGMVLLLWGLGRVGLSGPGWAAALQIAGGALAVPAVLVAAGAVAGEARARAAAPFLALAPTATAVATSADALFAGVGAWAVALVVMALARPGTRAALLAAGGVLLGVTLLLTYGGILLGAVAGPAIMARRRPGPAALAVSAAGAVVLGAALLGFWWPEGLAASVGQYEAGISRFRPYSYFLVANLAAFAAVLGPATAAGLASLRHRGTWLLVAGGLLAVLLADLSGLSKGEVERIWLPFAPWLLLSAAALPPPRAQLWLGANALTALAIASMLRTPW
jgi:hypothetical protein